MKIRIAICTSDEQYSEKIVNYFMVHYYDKFTWNIFTESSYLTDFLKENDVDIVLAGKEMEEQLKTVADNDKSESIWVYLTDDEEEEIQSAGHKLEKYVRADKIYRELLELYSGKPNAQYRKGAIVNNKTDIYAVVSAAGGVGASTIACAMARRFADFENVLYINMENIGAMPLVYSEEGKQGFDEVLFALKSRKKALALKLASAVSRDKKGVYFLEESRNALDVMELSFEDVKELLVALQQMREYDKVILDVGNGLGDKEIAAMTCAGRVVVVTQDNEVAQKKFARYMEALQLVEEHRNVDICSKMIVFFNKVLRQDQLPEKLCQIRTAGGFPRIENGTYDGIVSRIAGMEMLQNVN